MHKDEPPRRSNGREAPIKLLHRNRVIGAIIEGCPIEQMAPHTPAYRFLQRSPDPFALLSAPFISLRGDKGGEDEDVRFRIGDDPLEAF